MRQKTSRGRPPRPAADPHPTRVEVDAGAADAVPAATATAAAHPCAADTHPARVDVDTGKV